MPKWRGCYTNRLTLVVVGEEEQHRRHLCACLFTSIPFKEAFALMEDGLAMVENCSQEVVKRGVLASIKRLDGNRGPASSVILIFAKNAQTPFLSDQHKDV